MASVGPISLDSDDAKTAVALWLRKKSSFSVDRIPPNGWKVSIRKDSEVVVATTSQLMKTDEAISSARNAIDQTLDLSCFRLNDPLELKDQESEAIVVTGSGAERTLTYRGYTRWDIRAASMRAVVIDADGKEKPQKEPAPWSPILRYYRLSQTREDIFDAYRYMFLALEALLHVKWPKPKNEREWDWLLRAIGELNKHVSLTAYASKSSGNPVEDFVKSQYGEIRLPLFHAKKSGVSSPHEGLTEDTVIEAYARLTRLVRTALNDLFNMQGPSAAITNYAFQQGFNALLARDNLQMAFTADHSTLEAHERKLSSIDAPIYAFNSIDAEPESNSDRRMIYSIVRLRPEMQKSLVGRVALQIGDDPVVISRPDTPFSLEKIGHFECQIVVIFKNLNLPKWT